MMMKTRLETMTPVHCSVFIGLFLAFLVLVFGASFRAPDMLAYNLGDSQTCAHEFSAFFAPTPEVAAIMNEQIASECLSTMHQDGNIWVGRVAGLTLKNQLLLVYGYVDFNSGNSSFAGGKPDLKLLCVETFGDIDTTVSFFAKIRGKTQGKEDWTIV